MWNSGFRVPGFGSLISGLGFGVENFGVWVFGSGFRVEGFGILFEGPGSGSESRVWGLKKPKHFRKKPISYQLHTSTSIANTRFPWHMNCTFASTSIACCIEHIICISEKVETCPDLCYFKPCLYASNSIFTLIVR